MIGALGVVFGDIVTSPIYTIQTIFHPGEPHPVILADQTAISSPLFLLVPGWARLPMVLLATAATVIACSSTSSVANGVNRCGWC